MAGLGGRQEEERGRRDREKPVAKEEGNRSRRE